MSVKLQIIIGVIIVASLASIINMVRTKKIDLKHALSWMFLSVLLLLLDIFPQILFKMAEIVGVEIPSNMIFMAGYLLLIWMVYSLTVTVSRISTKTKQLTQEVALLRDEIERLNKKSE